MPCVSKESSRPSVYPEARWREQASLIEIYAQTFSGDLVNSRDPRHLARISLQRYGVICRVRFSLRGRSGHGKGRIYNKCLHQIFAFVYEVVTCVLSFSFTGKDTCSVRMSTA